jgi:uncharacterized C2H2 Zn-finger protein
MIPKRQSGKHTWDLYIRYHKCPSCNYIIESREDYEYEMGKYIKHLECSRCKHEFTEVKEGSQTIGPLIGKPEKPEFDWS